MKRWGEEDKKTVNFERRLDSFIKQIETNVTLRTVFLELIKQYNYYSRKHIEELLKQFYKKVTDDLRLVEDVTIYSRIEDDSKIDSSNSFLEEFKVINEISNHFSHAIEKLKEADFNEIENIVFLDDVIGSGNTVKTFFEENKSKLLKVNNFIFCIEVLDEAKDFLNEYFRENGFECKIISGNIHKKAFCEDHIFDDRCKDYEQLLKDFEMNLWGGRKRNKNILGYENSQATISFFRNTPNNTISSFWYQNKMWEGLFPRDDRKPLFKRGNRNKKNAVYNMSRLKEV